MVGAFLIGGGAVLMVLGVVMLLSWMSGKANWFDQEVLDGKGDSTPQRRFVDLLFLSLYFLALVIVPILAGATMIVYGLVHLG
jgi:hypothetical protein